MVYAGEERRVHKVFVTRNSEYHVRGDLCIAVRDRESRQWQKSHLALRGRVAGALRFHPGGGIVPNVGRPSLGESLLFQGTGRDVITSSITSIERPPVEIVEGYATA